MRDMELTTRQRIGLLGPVVKEFPELGLRNRQELAEWVALELGSVDALDRWTKRGPHFTRARAPRSIYHLAPGNVAVAAWQSILIGSLLGAENRVKLPRAGSEAIRHFVRRLPSPLRQRVKFETAFRPAALQAAEAVIAFGRDETIREIRRQLLPKQVFLSYGHRVSLLWLGRVTGKETVLFRAAARDIALYDQLGCLSPQAVYIDAGSNLDAVGAALAAALEQEVPDDAATNRLEAAAAIRQARQLARASGARIWESDETLRWTVIADPDPAFREGCGYRVIPVRKASRTQLRKVLAPLRGMISTVGLRMPLERADEELFWEPEAQRLCPVGECQHPPASWHHDGRPRLSDLVKWVDREG